MTCGVCPRPLVPILNNVQGSIMFTISKASAVADLVFRWRTVTAAGAVALSGLGFALGVLAAPALA